jgi:hypothetical protein
MQLQTLTFCLFFLNVDSFMPNLVFSFRPPSASNDQNVLPDVEIEPDYGVQDFYPVEAEDGPLADGSWTHKDIIRRACLNTLARFFEETERDIAPGSLQNLISLTPTNLLRAVFGPTASTSNFERAIEQMEIAAAKMDLFYEKNASISEAANVARAHFDDEQFQLGHEYLLQLRRQMFAALQQGAVTAARDLAGRYMLTLQDFYAHSNYVELGQTEPLKELGKPGPNVFANMTDKSAITCADCVPSSDARDCNNNACRDNADPSVQSNILTSGFFFYPTDNNYNRQKPPGKCSHGDPTDRSRLSSATGGINKSTRNCRKSPHYFLHDEAAELAVKATEVFLMGIRDVIGDNEFLRLFDLGIETRGSSLCFVVDQSGSMRNDIAAARDRVKQIVQSSKQPYNYVLVQFNDYDQDPAFGPAVVTQDAHYFSSQVDALNANGGGDCPELAMHGLRLALINCLPGSPIYLFTDAGPKDYDLQTAIFSLIDRTGSQVNFFFTGPSPPCGLAPNLFADIATRSGGQFLDVTKSTVATATALTQASVETVQVTILSVTGNTASGTYNFTVDCTVSAITISVSGHGPMVNVSQPDGSSNVHQSVSLPNFVLFNVSSPAFGEWRIVAAFSASYHSVVVRATSNIAFSHNFVFVGGRPGHLGVFPITGLPVLQKLSKLVLTVDGLEEVTSIGSVDLVQVNSTAIIDSYIAEQGNGYSNNLFGVAFFLPPQPFRLQIQGTDKCGYNFTRVSATEIEAQSIDFSSNDNIVDNVVEPGSFTNATFILHNSGETDTFTVVLDDTQGFSRELSVIIENESVSSGRHTRAVDSTSLSKDILLKQNQSALVTATLGAPPGAAIGQATTATITASSHNGSAFNYVVLQIVVTPEEHDDIPPLCQITNYSLCTNVTAFYCSKYMRNVTARIQDTGVGLQSIRSRQRDVVLHHIDFESGMNETVEVIAMASCCHLNIDIQSSDVVGNLHICSSVIPPGVINDEISM